MILPFEPYDPKWKMLFLIIADKLHSLLDPFAVQIDHIGSTSVEGLSAKPIIDIQLGVEKESDLDKIVELLQLPNLVYYEKYNKDMPSRRFFILYNQSVKTMDASAIVKLDEEIPQILHNHDLHTAHIHTFVKSSDDWIRHIAFRDYLRSHPDVKNEYQELKQKLIQNEWKDGNEYNKAKDIFFNKYNKIVLKWYEEIQFLEYNCKRF